MLTWPAIEMLPFAWTDPEVPATLEAQLNRELELIARLEETRSMRRTAHSLGISQPAATKALREVERLFGFPLFAYGRFSGLSRRAGATRATS